MVSSRKTFACRVLLTTSALFSVIHAQPRSLTTTASFSPDNSAFQRLVSDIRNGHVYVGARNRIYHLDSDLNVINDVMTGPVMDNPFCGLSDFLSDSVTCTSFSTDHPKTSTDTYNKILALNTESNQLVTCGSTFQGTCQLRALTNITVSEIKADSVGQYVAANDARSSTVGFTAPDGQLYVGTSYNFYTGSDGSTNKDAREQVPRVCSRSIDSLELVFSPDFSPGSFVQFKTEYLESYPVKYITGFHVDGYSYFLTNQMVSPNNNTYISKLIQVCSSDQSFSSYVDIPIRCQDGSGVDYALVQAASAVQAGSKLSAGLSIASGDHVLIAAFSKAADSTSGTPVPGTAMCLFKFSDIRQKVAENLQGCYDTSISSRGDQFTGFTGCLPFETTISDDFCGGLAISNAPLAGPFGISSESVKIFPNTKIAAVISTNVDDFTVVFLGSSDGHLKKLTVGDNSMTEIEDLTIQNDTSILQDMAFSPDDSHLHIMTSNSVYKIPSWDCARFTDCASCVGFGDPHCGWCSLENKCSARVDCLNDGDAKRWLSIEAWSCITVSDTQPQRISLAVSENVILTVTALPQLSNDNSYECVFGSDDSITTGSVTGNDVSCPTPANKPDLPNGADHIDVTLYLRSTETGIKFLRSSLTFYSCEKHLTCSSCTEAPWGCRWCIHSNECVDRVSQCNISSSEIVTVTESCPRLLGSSSSRLLLPARVSTEFTLEAENLPIPLEGQAGYVCHVFTQSPPSAVSATRLSPDLLRCDASEYNFASIHGPSFGAFVDVVWGDNFELEDKLGITATIFKCPVLGQDCSECLSLSLNPETAAYNCSWCSDGCQHNSRCTSIPATTCPGPDIQSIEPITGPLQGGTPITIYGSNLGKSLAHVNNTVTIDGQICDVVEYEVSNKIVCKTRPVQANGSHYIQMEIDGKSDFSEEKFTFQDPILTSFDPELMPLSGNTLLTLTGTNLKTGSRIRVLLGSNNNCSIQTLENEQVICDPPKIQEPDEFIVKMEFDGGVERMLLRNEFEYKPDPNVSKITPLKTFLSGGREVTITGNSLDTVRQPKLYFENLANNATNCSFVVDCLCLKCPFPVVSSVEMGKRRRRQTEVRMVSLDMDGVSSVKNLSLVQVYPDPVYDKFKNNERVYKGEALILNGSNLDLACSREDVVVSIGEELCAITALDTKQLYCSPPEKQPEGVSSSLPRVTVVVGNLRYELGVLRYDTASDNTYLIIGSAVGGGVLIFIIIVILIVYKRSSSQAERQYKKIQLQLVTLESNVRNECKLAFAELQTEVSDFTSDLNLIGIPFWDYKAYTFKVLFPSHKDHAILHRTPSTYTNQYGGYEEGIHQFNQLLNSKHFLLIFIRTLEAQKNFGIRDKAVVASLLMVVMQDKMEYATEILKALLNELVDRSVEKKHPKLMLRRTESVVEKLVTNWLSLCMYTYLKKHAGKTLYMLYKAIKHQTEKGPIDGISSEARYSLSEDRLLREKIDAKTLTIQLYTDSNEIKEPVLCKMLDCDTITQAKEKALDAVYMNKPYQQRPALHHVDLVWKSGQSGHLPLRDEDVTTQTVNGWKRVNTLAHYHVPDNATLSLVTVSEKNDLVREVHGMVEISSGTSLSAITPIVTMEEGTKIWHLVKHDDSQSGNQRGQKVISEIFLTRLLATKGTLQQYIDDLFGAVLRADSTLPPAVKYLFDFFDSAARRHNIVDSEVVYTWKSNSLPLRFWVNIIKNPEFIFDINKSHIVDSCLSVIAQTFMDSCSTSEHRLGKDSPSNKLLFAKDIPRYRQMVSQFYKNVQEMPPVSDQEMTRVMTELSMTNITDFNVAVALKELYKYSMQYSFELSEALDDDNSSRKMHLAKRFDQVMATIEGAQYY